VRAVDYKQTEDRRLSYCSQGEVASTFRKEIAQSSSDSSRFVVQ